MKTYYVGLRSLSKVIDITICGSAVIEGNKIYIGTDSGLLDYILFECTDSDIILLETLKGTIETKINHDLYDIMRSLYFDTTTKKLMHYPNDK